MPLSFRHFLSLAGLALASGFFACREPTQITLNVTTDALCPQSPLTAPRLVDATFATGKLLDPTDFTAATLTDQCESGDPNVVGTLVLLPSGSNDLTVEVLVVAGVELAGPAAEVDPLRLSSEGCQELIRVGGVGAIQGKPCILVRRRLGFVEHTKLELPIDLDTRCIGKKCGEDESCFKGNCVPIDVDCNASGCVEPETCPEKCDEFCTSGNSTCVDNACQCFPCDETACAAACGLKHQIGECEDDVCLCRPACDQAECTAECMGECVGATCGCSSCDADVCEAGGPSCQCQGSSGQCACIGPCDEDDCETLDCGAFGFVGACGQLMGKDACVCACQDAECDMDCEFGGSCQAGVCGCNSECVDADCVGQCSTEWKKDQCYDGGCLCMCDPTLCAQSCDGVPGSMGSHCTLPGDPAGVCDCEVGNPTGGNGSGAGGTGGDGGNGGASSSSSSSGGFGGMGGDGGNGVSTSSGFGGMTLVAGSGATLCLAGSYSLPGCTPAGCTSLCNANDCSTGICLGPNTCECN